MKGNAKVIEYLNLALRSELAAINQYWLHYRLFDDWGLGKLADKERKESIEEMEHADSIVERIIFLNGHPNMQTLDPLRIGQNVKEALECDLAAEHDAHKLYTEAREVCKDASDYTTMRLFEQLLADEEDHIDFLETQLQLIEDLGVERYSLLQAKPADDGA